MAIQKDFELLFNEWRKKPDLYHVARVYRSINSLSFFDIIQIISKLGDNRKDMVEFKNTIIELNKLYTEIPPEKFEYFLKVFRCIDNGKTVVFTPLEKWKFNYFDEFSKYTFFKKVLTPQEYEEFHQLGDEYQKLIYENEIKKTTVAFPYLPMADIKKIPMAAFNKYMIYLKSLATQADVQNALFEISRNDVSFKYYMSAVNVSDSNKNFSFEERCKLTDILNAYIKEKSFFVSEKETVNIVRTLVGTYISSGNRFSNAEYTFLNRIFGKYYENSLKYIEYNIGKIENYSTGWDPKDVIKIYNAGVKRFKEIGRFKKAKIRYDINYTIPGQVSSEENDKKNQISLLIRDFIESDCISLKEYCFLHKIDQHNIEKAVKKLETIDPNLYKEYKEKVNYLQGQRYSIIIEKGRELIQGLKNGVSLDDGITRPFDLIDYYQLTGIDFDTLYDIMQKSGGFSNDLGIIRSRYRYLSKRTPLNVKRLYESYEEYDIKFDSNGNRVNGTGRVIEKEEKEALVKWLQVSKIPLYYETYHDALLRWRNGYLKMPTEYNRQERIK